MRNPYHLKEKHPQSSYHGCLEEKTRRCWLHSLLLLWLLLAVGGSPSPSTLFPAKAEEAVAGERMGYSDTSTQAQTHTHVLVSSFTLQLNWKERKAFLSFPIPPINRRIVFTFDPSQDVAAEASCTAHPDQSANAAQHSWRMNTRHLMCILHLQSTLSDTHFPVDPSVLPAVKH